MFGPEFPETKSQSQKYFFKESLYRDFYNYYGIGTRTHTEKIRRMKLSGLDFFHLHFFSEFECDDNITVRMIYFKLMFFASNAIMFVYMYVT